MTRVQFGWLIRSIHSWSANLMIFTAFVHMFSVLFLKAYRKPRELTWVTGMLLLFLVMGFGFSGYLLPWNKLAFFATTVGTQMAGQVPVIGQPMMIFLRGGPQVTGATLTRFFGFHVAVLPTLVTVLIAIHLFLVQRQGMSVPPKVEVAVDRESLTAPGDEVLSQLPAARIDGLVRGHRHAGRAGRPVSRGTWASRQILLRRPRRESSPSGTSSSCTRRSSSSPRKCGSSTARFWAYSAAAWPALFWLLLPFFESDKPARTKAWITGLGIFALVYMIVMSVYGYVAQ